MDTKPKFRNKYNTEWNMAQWDFIRYDKWLGEAEKYSVAINSGDASASNLKYFRAVLRTLYISWKPLISTRDRYEEILKLTLDSISKISVKYDRDIAYNTVILLNEFHENLLNDKQFIGLGTPFKKVLSLKQKFKNIGG